MTSDRHGVVATVDRRATRTGVEVLERGGGAVDAAIAANAVLSVTAPHLCGMGGDLFALVFDGATVCALNASGRSGSGADAAELRRDGHVAMPLRHDVRSVTVPGCVDGWIELHRAGARLSLAELLAPAIELAEHGCGAASSLVESLRRLDPAGRAALAELADEATAAGARVRRPGLATALTAIAEEGRDGFYRGSFGRGLAALAPELFTDDDLDATCAEWVEPLAVATWGHVVHTFPPNSQGYLTLGAAAIAEALGIPDDQDDPRWPHVLIEASILAAYDRPDRLHDQADGPALLRRIIERRGRFDADGASLLPIAANPGDTTYVGVVDDAGVGVSLIQSNGSGFGSWLAEPTTGINLHNRAVGFNLLSGHPAELGPRRRPPHTLAPALVTRPDGTLAVVVGSAGGDAQPQIVLQLLARLLRHGESAADAVGAARWVLRSGPTGFDTWTNAGPATVVRLESGAPAGWVDGLRRRGHLVEMTPRSDGTFGHAHAITVSAEGGVAGSAEPRTGLGPEDGVSPS